MRINVRSFNRTFMELKYNNTISIALKLQSFNRTFMELKYHNNQSDS